MAFEPVNVKRTEYSLITDALEMKQYISNRISNGEASVLYNIPNIPSTVYIDGTAKATAIQAAINAYGLTPSKANTDNIKVKVAEGVIWLDGLVVLVEAIANNPANAATREAAAVNIEIIGFIAEKLIANSKGTPDKALFTATYVGGGIIEIAITNGVSYAPANVMIIAVGNPPATDPVSPLPVVSFVGGQVLVTSKVSVPMVTKTYTGKGTSAKLIKMDSCASWNIYIYSMNGNKLISELSVPVSVVIFTPPVTV